MIFPQWIPASEVDVALLGYGVLVMQACLFL
jgi:hypothetical protein